MTSRPKKPSSRPYDVGYRKPPLRTRFKKGTSGNPRGRPRGITADRAIKLLLQEVYRPIKVLEGDQVTTLTGLQVVMRRLVALGAKGNGPAARMIIAQTMKLEQDLKAAESAADARTEAIPITDEMRARALRAFLEKTNYFEILKT